MMTHIYTGRKVKDSRPTISPKKELRKMKGEKRSLIWDNKERGG